MISDADWLDNGDVVTDFDVLSVEELVWNDALPEFELAALDLCPERMAKATKRITRTRNMILVHGGMGDAMILLGNFGSVIYPTEAFSYVNLYNLLAGSLIMTDPKYRPMLCLSVLGFGCRNSDRMIN
jgi:hypothetical protein